MVRMPLPLLIVGLCFAVAVAAFGAAGAEADAPAPLREVGAREKGNAEAPAASSGESPGTTTFEGCRVTPNLLVKRQDALYHPAVAGLRHLGPPTELTIQVEGREVLKQTIDAETTEVEFLLSALESEVQVRMTFSTSSGVMAEETIALAPARKLEIFLLPHSHVDIGYTKLQTKVERDHWEFIEQAIEAVPQTGTLSTEAQFKWNVEVLWALDGYLRQASPEKRTAFVSAVQRGQIGLDAFYCHELAGLCRPEELVRLLACARRMGKEFGVPIESAMVTDCPGLTWGAVPVLAQSGVKYLSLGPNSGHRIGYAREAWDNRPFWWVSPCGQHKVLCWQTDNSYHPVFSSESELRTFLEDSRESIADHPYDILYYRQCKGDNRGPDLGLSDFVENWNARFAYPRLIIATTAEAFRAFESRYGDVIPSEKGDFSPYWEDGAASSARETAVNRAAAERLVQAETLWAMLNPAAFPGDVFDEAWRNVLLYDEHTWGARSYVNRGHSYPPGSRGYDAQWRIKQAFALEADSRSHELLAGALAERRGVSNAVAAVDVFNTSSWPRSDLVLLPRDLELRGESVRDAAGKALPSQRLASGELAVLVRDVPPFGALRLTFHEGSAVGSGAAEAVGNTLTNGSISATVDEQTGAIRRLLWEEVPGNLVDAQAAGLNSYHYVAGFHPKDAISNGPVSIRVLDQGPLVATLRVESDAPGCQMLVREIRVIDGLNCVEVTNIVDKKAILLEDLLKAEPQKEGFHFGFAFHVPDGVLHVDMPWAVVRPESDQLSGSCKNWLSAQRWVDISNKDFGVTWATVDAPLIEVGTMSPQPTDPFAKDTWRKTIEPTQTLYSYVMNNYWTTNYRHDQEGLVTFRYAIAPHKDFDTGAATRFGIGRSQPLIVVPVDGSMPAHRPFVEVASQGAVVTSLKPITNEDAWALRLFGASGQAEQASVRWGDGAPARIWRSNLDGAPTQRITEAVELLPFEMVTLRIEGVAGSQ